MINNGSLLTLQSITCVAHRVVISATNMFVIVVVVVVVVIVVLFDCVEFFYFVF